MPHQRRDLPIEIKLAQTVGDDDVVLLKGLRSQLGEDFFAAIVVTTDGVAYRRRDGVRVVPAVLLRP